MVYIINPPIHKIYEHMNVLYPQGVDFSQTERSSTRSINVAVSCRYPSRKQDVYHTRRRLKHVFSLSLQMFLYHSSPTGPINELQRCPSRVWSQGMYPSLPGSRLRFSTLTPRQIMVELFLLASSRFPPLRNQEKSALLLALELTH